MKLSIIICVYNTAVEYLSECLESITHSTLSDLAGEYEICMVDDGSTVDYSELIRRYGVRYVKTENRGILSARTTGIGMASGAYSAFFDSDDTVSFHYHLPMVMRAEETGADIVINDWAFHTPKMRYYCKNDSLIKYDLDVSGDATLPAFFKHQGAQHSYYVLWNKVYKTELLRHAFEELHSSPLPKDCSYSEDTAVNFFAWRDADRIVNIHTGFYFYRQHDSQTVNVTSEEKLRSQIVNMSACLDLMRKGVGEHPDQKKLLKQIQGWAELMARSHYSQAKENRYTALYALIRERYRVKRLRGVKSKDGKAYVDNVLLGRNFTEIDACLLEAWNSPTAPSVKHHRKDGYTDRSVRLLSELGKVIPSKKRSADVKIPKRALTVKERIVHNPHVYRIGSRLFKKGSGIRKLLKKML